MRKLIFSLAATILTATAVACGSTQSQGPPVSSIPVLEYHGISTTPLNVSSAPYNVDVPAFTRQMSWLHSRGYQSVNITQYTAWLEGKPVMLPSKPVLITFDDGRQDSVLALPVLRQYGYQAAMFVVTAYANQSEPGQWETWQTLLGSGWDLQFHAGLLGHLTWQHPYYGRVPLADSQKDITTGVNEFHSITGTWPQTWAVPNGTWTAPLASWAATRFAVVWVEGGTFPPAAAAAKYHMRYRLEIYNGLSAQQMAGHLSDVRFSK